MNLILLFDDDFVDPGSVRLTGRRLAYVRSVHRAAVGDALRVGKVNGRVGTGMVTALDERELVLDVRFDRDPPPAAALTLLLALPRPKALRRVLQCIASMGVKRLVLFNTWRVEKSFWDSPALDETAVREQLLLGLEQGGDTVMPTVEMRRRFKPFVEDEMRGLIAETQALVAHPPGGEALVDELAPPQVGGVVHVDHHRDRAALGPRQPGNRRACDRPPARRLDPLWSG